MQVLHTGKSQQQHAEKHETINGINSRNIMT
jgi:hypothetical protein